MQICIDSGADFLMDRFMESHPVGLIIFYVLVWRNPALYAKRN